MNGCSSEINIKNVDISANNDPGLLTLIVGLSVGFTITLIFTIFNSNEKPTVSFSSGEKAIPADRITVKARGRQPPKKQKLDCEIYSSLG